MASSGSYTTTLRSDLYLRIDWSIVSQDVTNNTSNVRVQLVLGANYSVSAGTTSKNGNITINGDSAFFTFTIGNYSGAWSKVIGENTVTVPHNSDGTMTVALSAWADINITWSGKYVARGSVSGSPTLDAIPRASYLSIWTAFLEAGSAFTGTIVRASNSFTHDVSFVFGSNTAYISNLTTSISYTIPAQWLDAIPNSTSGTMTVWVTTKNNGTIIGSKSYTVTITAPTSVVPYYSSLGVTRVDGPVPAAWNVYVQNKSKVTLSINAPSGIYGSTISSYSISGAGSTKNTQTATFDLPSSGTITFIGTITDSRGRTTSKTTSIVVEPYSTPIIASSVVDRCLSTGVLDDEGTYVRSIVDYSVSSVANKNTTITTLLEYKASSASTWTSGGSFSDNVAKISGGGNISTNDAYDIRVTVTDAFESTTTTNIISTAFVTMDFYKDGTGIAFGRVSTVPNLLDSSLPLRIPSLTVRNPTTNADWLTANNNNVLINNGNFAINGTSYNQITEFVYSNAGTAYGGFTLYSFSLKVCGRNWNAWGSVQVNISLSQEKHVEIPFIYWSPSAKALLKLSTSTMIAGSFADSNGDAGLIAITADTISMGFRNGNPWNGSFILFSINGFTG